jgi:polysaccharide deacetylase 2 family uncharacterized protein YibQ
VAASEAGRTRDYNYGLPAIREERRPGGLMVAYGVTLALVVGSAALAFGFIGSEQRGATTRALPTNLPTPTTTPPGRSAAAATPATAPTTPPAAAAPATPPPAKLTIPSSPAPAAPTTQTADAKPAPPQGGSLKLPPRTPTAPTAAAPKEPNSPGLPQNRPLIQSLPDPATSSAAWQPTAPNGLPTPPPEKPTPPSSFRALPPVDSADMIEVTSDGLRLPKVSPVGWMPWIAYARRYSPDGPAARVGLMMINVGANEPLMKRAIENMPGEVSLAFLPGTPDLNRWMQRARDYGHEVYMMLPVEDPGGPAERGIKPIETSVDATENIKRLRAAMARGEGYVGFVIPFPGPVSQSEATIRPVLKEISERGLGVIEINAAQNAPNVYRLSAEFGTGYARNSSVLDYKATRQNIDENLDRMVRWVSEQPANIQGGGKAGTRHAFGVVQPNPAAIDAIADWAKRLASVPDVALLPIIGHFECREACMTRVKRLQAQLKQ